MLPSLNLPVTTDGQNESILHVCWHSELKHQSKADSSHNFTVLLWRNKENFDPLLNGDDLDLVVLSTKTGFLFKTIYFLMRSSRSQQIKSNFQAVKLKENVW